MPKHLDLNSMPRHIIASRLESVLLKPHTFALFHRKADSMVEALRNFQRKSD